MWKAIFDFLLKVKAQGLSHEAVIEIMIAILGIMVAILTLVSALFAAIVTVAGVFGYQAIRDEAKRRSETVARRTASRVARETATKIARGIRDQVWAEVQASGMSEGQTEPLAQALTPQNTDGGVKPTSARKRRKATDDFGLKDGGAQ